DFAASALGLKQVHPAAVNPEVRVIYLVPSDREPRNDYQVVMANALRHLQMWYWAELSEGKTFLPHNPVVETVRSRRDSLWFTTNQTGDNPGLNLWFNAVAESSAKFNDPDFIYLVYADVDATGQSIGGTSGVALLARHDLEVLAGEHPSELVCRSVGGLGHELGHALGLPHPPECDSHQAADDSPPCQSLMYLGYLTYPATHFTDGHKGQLLSNPFITSQPSSQPSKSCFDLAQAGPFVGSAVFEGKKELTIEGRFGDAARVIINGKDRTKFVTGTSETLILLTAKKKKLGIKSGDNTLQVTDATGFVSNIVTIQL
ncbi:MAG TPA: hypothetical protein VJQ56_03605, partial [Blastocatellia bacterium]|nr:hypothetical protein [Blastocatellia bacterium]